MNVIYKTNKVQKEILYPALDITQQLPALNKAKKDGKLVDIDPKSDEFVTLYFIQEIRPENTKPEQFDLVQQPDVLTDKFHSEYKHLKICIREWKLTEKSEHEIIDRLNYEVGNYLDSEYPVYKRDKDLRSIALSKEKDSTKLKYLNDLDAWIDTCRLERDNREALYLQNKTANFPIFDKWPKKPVSAKK